MPVAHNVSCPWVGRRSIPHHFLQMCDVTWGNCPKYTDCQARADVDSKGYIPRSGYIRSMTTLFGTPTSSSSKLGTPGDDRTWKSPYVYPSDYHANVPPRP